MIQFEITFDDRPEPVRITADMRDVARWEMNGEGRALSDLQGSPHIVDLYELAFYSLRRQKLYDGTLDGLLDVANVMPQKDAEAPKATRKGRISTRS